MFNTNKFRNPLQTLLKIAPLNNSKRKPILLAQLDDSVIRLSIVFAQPKRTSASQVTASPSLISDISVCFTPRSYSK